MVLALVSPIALPTGTQDRSQPETRDRQHMERMSFQARRAKFVLLI